MRCFCSNNFVYKRNESVAIALKNFKTSYILDQGFGEGIVSRLTIVAYSAEFKLLHLQYSDDVIEKFSRNAKS